MQKIFDAKKENLHEVLGFIEAELEARDCNMKTQMMILIMVEEIFVNIASYAYPDGHGTAIIDLGFEEDVVSIKFTDSGIAFNPLEKEDPDISLSAEERDIGGLGIYLVKKTMEDVKYERIDDKNIFSFKKGLH